MISYILIGRKLSSLLQRCRLKHWVIDQVADAPQQMLAHLVIRAFLSSTTLWCLEKSCLRLGHLAGLAVLLHDALPIGFAFGRLRILGHFGHIHPPMLWTRDNLPWRALHQPELGWEDAPALPPNR